MRTSSSPFKSIEVLKSLAAVLEYKSTLLSLYFYSMGISQPPASLPLLVPPTFLSPSTHLPLTFHPPSSHPPPTFHPPSTPGVCPRRPALLPRLPGGGGGVGGADDGGRGGGCEIYMCHMLERERRDDSTTPLPPETLFARKATPTASHP